MPESTEARTDSSLSPAALPGDRCDPVRASVPNAARMYDYWLGGRDNYAADREAADMIAAVYPHPERVARANRAFHQQAAARISGWGVRQFLDLGCGLPTLANTHDVVQWGVHRASAVVYLDHDPVVIMHGRALLADADEVTVIQADARQPDEILAHPALLAHIDLGEPCALLATAVMHFVRDDDDPHGCIAALMAALAPGSCLVLSHGTADDQSPAAVAATTDAYAPATSQIYPRPQPAVARFFDGLELVAPYAGTKPGIVRPGLSDTDRPVPLWCGIGRKPIPEGGLWQPTTTSRR